MTGNGMTKDSVSEKNACVQLQEVQMVHRENGECEQSIEGSNAVMTDTMICAGAQVRLVCLSWFPFKLCYLFSALPTCNSLPGNQSKV